LGGLVELYLQGLDQRVLSLQDHGKILAVHQDQIEQDRRFPENLLTKASDGKLLPGSP